MNGREQVEKALSAAGAFAGFAAGAAMGIAAERFLIGRSLAGPDPYVQEPFGALRGTPYVVPADDGVELYVEVDEPGDRADAALPTVIFTHGYALNLDCWHFQRRDLAGAARLVFWDQRCHGRSGRGGAGPVSMAQLGSDLGRVVDHVAPEGPLVLVGHSMGGMTVMALAEQRRELFADRVAGVGLLATSAGDLDRVTLGVPGPVGRFAHRLAPGVVSALARRPEVIDRARREGSDLGYFLTKHYAFGASVPGSLVEFTAEMLAGTPIDVIAEFLPIFGTHDKREALAALHDIETVVVGAVRDLVTPVEHSREIARLLPLAQYVEAPDTGHMVLLERHAVVTRLLAGLIRQVRREAAAERRAARPQPRSAATRRTAGGTRRSGSRRRTRVEGRSTRRRDGGPQ